LIISSIYLTASASNPVLVSKVVSIYGHEYELHFVKWFIGAIVPGAIVILIVPQVISMYLKQGNIDLEHTQTYSERMLRQMKSITTNEKVNIYINLFINNFFFRYYELNIKDNK